MTSGTSSAPNVCCLSTPTKEAWRKAERQEGWKDVKRWHATYCVWECRWKISRKPLESQKKKLRNTSDKSCSNKKRREANFSPFFVPRPGLEPGWVAPLVFETSASTDSAIWALAFCVCKGITNNWVVQDFCDEIIPLNHNNCSIRINRL